MKFQTLRKGIEVFGSKEKFRNWLNIPILAMGGKKPLEYSWKEILSELYRIEHGIFS